MPMTMQSFFGKCREFWQRWIEPKWKMLLPLDRAMSARRHEQRWILSWIVNHWILIFCSCSDLLRLKTFWAPVHHWLICQSRIETFWLRARLRWVRALLMSQITRISVTHFQWKTIPLLSDPLNICYRYLIEFRRIWISDFFCTTGFVAPWAS